MKIIGKCKQCGKCCKDIQLDLKLGRGDLSLLRMDLDKMKDDLILTHIKQNPHLDLSKSIYLNFLIEDDMVAMKLFNVECRALRKRKGKYFCSVHKNKPPICEKFPQANSTLHKGCGYKKIEDEKK